MILETKFPPKYLDWALVAFWHLEKPFQGFLFTEEDAAGDFEHCAAVERIARGMRATELIGYS